MSPFQEILVYINEKKRNKEGEQSIMPPDTPSDGQEQKAFPPFDIFYDRYHIQVYRYLYAHLRDEQDVADLMQQIFFQAWKQRQTYQPERGAVATWLLSIAHHRLVDFYRLSRPSVPLDDISDIAVSEQNPEAKVLSEESIAVVRELLAALPQSERELLVLRFAAGLSSGEIAVVIGKSEAATKKQLTRLLHRLREQYRRRDLETPIPGLLEPTLPELVALLLRIYTILPPVTYSTNVKQPLLTQVYSVSVGRE
jgi:RNA polymerase sigma-70 factor, ECF subfamily